MALRRLALPLSTAVALAVVAVVVLPSRPLTSGFGSLFGMFEWVRGTSFTPRRGVHVPTLYRLRDRWTARLEEESRADSILALARGPRAVRSEDGMVSVVFEPPLTADAGRAWLRSVAGELAIYPAGGTGGVPVAVAIYSDSARHFDRRRPTEFSWWRVRRFVRDSHEGAACVVEVNLLRRRRGGEEWVYWDGDGRGLRRGVLDYCALYARYGMPGPRIADWAGFDRYWMWRQESGLAGMLRETRRGSPPRQVQRDEPLEWWRRYEWETIGCVNGSDSLCVRTWALDGRPRGDLWYGYSLTAISPRFAVAQLVSGGDGARFGAFWRSPLAPEQALASAYGEPASSVIAPLMRRAFVARPPGPRAELRTLLSALGWAAAAIGLALAAVRNRETDA